jgi:hypothetical protein
MKCLTIFEMPTSAPAVREGPLFSVAEASRKAMPLI